MNGKTLTNFDINEYFNENICYPRDKFRILERCIINSDDSNGRGQHWVGFINKKDCIYFDSFGVAPLKEVVDQLKKHKVDCYYNEYRIQDFDSNKCGYFTSSFIKNVKDYDSFNKWLLQFDKSDFRKNDEIIMREFQ